LQEEIRFHFLNHYFITKLSVENFDKETDVILNNEFDRKSAQDDDYNYAIG
jgi:hypothetical protein